MDLNLVMEAMGIKENVSPDMSSYNEMVIHWRGSMPPPSLVDVTAKWNEISPAIIEAKKLEDYQNAVYEKLVAQGIDKDAMFKALWQKVVNNEPAEADAIKVIVDQAAAETPLQ